jgi:gamma-glutamyltranspeptidase / glutathione hydrolase
MNPLATSRRHVLALAGGGVAAMALPGSSVASIPGFSLRTSAVAAPDIHGARVGAQVLASGGHAVDAAVAVAFVLAVTYPEAGNLGGGGFMTGWSQEAPWFIDYRERAPMSVSSATYLDAAGQPIPGRTLVGNLAAGVPGTVHGLWEAHRRHGRIGWRQLLAPAIQLAVDGFEPDAQMVATLAEGQAELGGAQNLKGLFNSMRVGEQFRQPQLGRTLELIAARGPRGFYEGETARRIVAQMGRGEPRGAITAADLRAYRSVLRTPVQGRWRDMQVVSAPPPSSGGIALLQLLGMKQARSDLFQGVEHNSAQYIHLMAEMSKRVFADRAAYLGDPDFVDVPIDRLIEPAYIASRAAGLDPHRPSAEAAVPPGLERPQTTHFSVMDADGNAVSNTYTINGWYGSGVVVEGAGFLLNNEMDDFAVAPGVPNLFGVVGGAANAVAPGKRPLSSMTPTIVAKDGRPVMVVGSPGGSRIITTVFQTMVNVFDFGMDLEQAVNARRWHHQLVPENVLYTEDTGTVAPGVEDELVARGYTIERSASIGDVAALARSGGSLQTANDRRRRGHSLAVYTAG